MIKGAARRSGNVGRALVAAVAAAFVLVTLAAAFAPEAFAQEKKRRWFSLRNLFAPREERIEPGRPARSGSKTKVTRAKNSPSKKKRTVPREPEIVIQPKAPDARIVLVVGDFLGSALAEGLTQAYAENPNVTVVDRTRGSSGFVRSDLLDWPLEIKEIAAKEKPAAILLMLGANDRQQMRVGESREAAGSEAWTAEYERRTVAMATSLGGTKVPFAWFGLPAFKSTKMSDDVLVFNEFYRAATTGARGQFVDVWDGFVDENGAFATTGPDVSGQPVRLRTADGINFTSAGKRKLAFYAEKPLAKILGLSATGVPVASLGLPEVQIDPNNPLPVDRTLPISLNDPALDGGIELLGAPSTAGVAKAATESLTMGGMTAKPTPGRADDFSWPQQIAAPAPVQPVATDQATAAAR